MAAPPVAVRRWSWSASLTPTLVLQDSRRHLLEDKTFIFEDSRRKNANIKHWAPYNKLASLSCFVSWGSYLEVSLKKSPTISPLARLGSARQGKWGRYEGRDLWKLPMINKSLICSGQVAYSKAG